MSGIRHWECLRQSFRSCRPQFSEQHTIIIKAKSNKLSAETTMTQGRITLYRCTAFVLLSAMLASRAARAFVVARRTNALSRLSSTATAANPLLQHETLPKFDSIQPSDLTPAVQTLLKELETDFGQLEETLATDSSCPDYDSILPNVERLQFPLGYCWGIAGHLNGVKNSDELRTAYEENQGKIVQVFSKFSQSKPLYDALSKLEFDDADDSFEMSQKKRAVELSLQSMKLGGVGLEGAAKERFNEIRTRLASLSTTFSNNVLDETKAFSYTIDDPEIVANVPDSAKAMWANAHIQHLTSTGADNIPKLDPEQGPYRITLDMPSYIAVLSHLPDRAIREKVYMANIQRASEQNPDKNNIPYVYEILQLKQELAELLGYQNYAQVSLASKMAPSVEAIKQLAELVRAKALPAAEKELDEITQLAKEQGGDDYKTVEKLMPWDITYWSERLKESKFDLTEEETRPYFALPAVLEGMFQLLNRLFNVRVEAADGEAEVWHPDVRFFKVYDVDSNQHIASFYLDPYSRPENKRGGAWMDVCVGKSEATKVDVPVAYLTCNGSPPVGDTPSLMTFREVETLFHET